MLLAASLGAGRDAQGSWVVCVRAAPPRAGPVALWTRGPIRGRCRGRGCVGVGHGASGVRLPGAGCRQRRIEVVADGVGSVRSFTIEPRQGRQVGWYAYPYGIG